MNNELIKLELTPYEFDAICDAVRYCFVKEVNGKLMVANHEINTLIDKLHEIISTEIQKIDDIPYQSNIVLTGLQENVTLQNDNDTTNNVKITGWHEVNNDE
jgi:hypothetical protein